MRIKPIPLLLIIVVASFTITGVFRYFIIPGVIRHMDNDNNWPTPEEQLINWYTSMVDYINERYEDDTFEFIRRDTWSSHRIFVSSEKFPDERIMVSHVTGDGADYFNDDYLYYKFREQATAKIEEILADTLEHEFKLFYDNLSLGSGTYVFPADTSLSDYMSNLNSLLRFSAMVSPGYDISNPDVLVENLRKSFTENNIHVHVAAVIFCQDFDEYDALNIATLNHFRNSNANPAVRIASWSTPNVEFSWIEKPRR